MRSRRSMVGAGVVLGIVAASGWARADSPTDEASLHSVAFESSRPGINIGVSGQAVDLACGERCVLELPEGRYRVTATQADGRRSAQFVVIHGAAHVKVTPHNQTARVAGFVLMPAGAGTLGVGVGLLWWAGFKAIMLSLAGCTGDCYRRETSSVFWPGGVIVAGAGAVIGLTGVILWKANANARLEVTSLERRPKNIAHLRLQPAAGPRWAGLALAGRF